MNILKNKTALITGATGGIGKEISKVLHSSGAHVILVGTRINILKEISKKFRSRVDFIEGDLLDLKGFESKLKSLGLKIDILVNNAGITKDGLLIRMPYDDIDNVINLNLSTYIKITKLVLKDMMKNRFGRIISISSVVGFTGNPGQSNYCASKAGIIGFTKSLALEVASRGITVNAIAPGYIDTSMTKKLSEDQRHKILSNIPIGRMGLPVDIANSVKFLASNDASYITGNTMHINGGMAMI